jgi:hypothetical protein
MRLCVFPMSLTRKKKPLPVCLFHSPFFISRKALFDGNGSGDKRRRKARDLGEEVKKVGLNQGGYNCFWWENIV